jgi:hypothetical protein
MHALVSSGIRNEKLLLSTQESVLMDTRNITRSPDMCTVFVKVPNTRRVSIKPQFKCGMMMKQLDLAGTEHIHVTTVKEVHHKLAYIRKNNTLQD